MRPKAQLLSIRRGGWTMWFPPHEETGIQYGSSVRSGYRDSWKQYLHEMADSIVGADARPVPEEDIFTWAWQGPMCRPSLPDGMVHRIGQPYFAWADEPRAGRDPRLGNAGGFDDVALDVYLKLLGRFGGHTFDPRKLALKEGTL